MRSLLGKTFTWGCSARVNGAINENHKLGPKIVDFIFLGYTHNKIAYRLVKSKVPNVHVNSFIESHDVSLF